MKRLALLLLCAISLTSCWEVKDYPEPKRTRIQNNLYKRIAETLSDGGEAVNLVINLDRWLDESDLAEKNRVEDCYFSNYKLRADGSKVNLINTVYGNEHNITVETNGEDIRSVGSVWTIGIYKSTLSIECTAENVWRLETEGLGSMNGATALSITCVDESEEDLLSYTIEGRGFAWYDKSLESLGTVEYKIEKPMNITFGNFDQYLNPSSTTFCYGGELLFSRDLLSEAEYTARLVFESTNTYTIYYRGVSEYYYDGTIYEEYFYYE